MRSVLAAVAALSLLCSATTAEPAKPAPSAIKRFQFDATYEQGRVLKLKTPRGVTKYEYNPAGKLSRKILPTGITIDYFHGRDGKLVETRFSNGLVRTRHYDRSGRLSKIIGTDGYVLTVAGAGPARSVVVTGPKDYRFDLTPIIRTGRTSYASMMGKFRPKALVIASGRDQGCTSSWWADTDCDWSGAGDYEGGGSYDDGWGTGADEWGGDAGYAGDGSGVVHAPDDDFAYDWGGDAGAGEYGNEAGGGSSGDWAGAGGDPLLPSPGDYNYMRCMQTNCENQNVDFRRVCSREPVQNQEMCYRYTAKYYFKCERECWYASY